MNYRSISDMANCIRANAHRVPRDVDLVVGIPRSGMLAADIVALGLNVGVTDLYSYLRNDPIKSGSSRGTRGRLPRHAHDADHILLLDDSVYFGNAMDEARRLLSEAQAKSCITTCAIYAAPASIGLVDLAFEVVPLPRAFEWNVLHRKELSRYCVDIDGILCADPTERENDDASGYLAFLAGASPRIVPSHPIGHLVTSRLAKYREQTEAWLAQHGIEYDTLHMLEGVDAETRRREGLHAKFKAETYRRLRDTILFIESDPEQARFIAQTSGKPALCFPTQEFFEPGLSYAYAEASARTFSRKATRAIRRLMMRDRHG